MNREDFMKLQNGSDVRGVAIEGVEGEKINLTSEAANRIAQGFVAWYCKKTSKTPEQITIGLGRDSRVSGPQIKDAMVQGILSTGASVADCGYASTPSMFMSIIYPQTAFDAAVMITASHLPFNRNGMKFFDIDGGLQKEDITEILELASSLECREAQAVGHEERLQLVALIPMYAADLCQKIREGVQAEDFEHPLKGLHIVVDAGNGVGGFFADEILKPLGADTSGSQFLEPDGMFPNHIPNPENKEAMASIQKATLENQADLGLIFDTDVDRMSAVLANGREINRDEIIAMMSAILAKDCPGGTIVTDSVTSERLTAFLENELGMKHLCYKRGYKNVINKCKELNEIGIESPLAMETSGHGAMKENYYLDDGAYQAVKLLIALAKAAKDGTKIDSLIEKMSTEFADKEVRFKIEEQDYRAYGENMLKKFAENAAKMDCELPHSYEGVRVSFHTEEVEGWMLLRASLHDPVLVLNVEGRTEADCEKLLQIAEELMK